MAKRYMEFCEMSSDGSHGSPVEPSHCPSQNSEVHSWPSGIPPPSVSGSLQSVPVEFSIVSGMPSPSVSTGFLSSLGLSCGFVPSRYSWKSVTPPLSVSDSFHRVKYVSFVKLPPIPGKITTHPVVFSK